MSLNIRIFAFAALSILLTGKFVHGQNVRSLNNSGVDSYKKQQFVDAEINFKKGLEKSQESYELNYNLGDAYYKQQRYDEAIKSFQNSLTHTEDGIMKSKAFHNIGNSLLKSQKIKESVEAYKNSLKLNPDDKDTKYNLSYALSLLKQEQDQQQKNKNQNDKNKDKQDQKDQNKNNQQNPNKDDQKDQKQNQQNKDQTAQQDKLKQPEKNKISKEEAERILEALKNNEKDLQKKLRKKVGIPITTDKDW